MVYFYLVVILFYLAIFYLCLLHVRKLIMSDGILSIGSNVAEAMLMEPAMYPANHPLRTSSLMLEFNEFISALGNRRSISLF